MRREDFTEQLVACLHTRRAGRRVISAWEPDAIAAPERHVHTGIDANLSLDAIYTTILKSNDAFDTIESMLNISLHKSFLTLLQDKDIDEEKEQVWLFAYKWLTKYYDALMEPDIMHTPFYRQDHDRFIELLTKMCAVLPDKRITFVDAVRIWCPGILTQASEDDDVVSVDVAETHVAETHVAETHVAVMDGPSTNLPSSSDSSVRRRLALKGLVGPQGRSKTRRSSRN